MNSGMFSQFPKHWVQMKNVGGAFHAGIWHFCAGSWQYHEGGFC